MSTLFNISDTTPKCTSTHLYLSAFFFPNTSPHQSYSSLFCFVFVFVSFFFFDKTWRLREALFIYEGIYFSVRTILTFFFSEFLVVIHVEWIWVNWKMSWLSLEIKDRFPNLRFNWKILEQKQTSKIKPNILMLSFL